MSEEDKPVNRQLQFDDEENLLDNIQQFTPFQNKNQVQKFIDLYFREDKSVLESFIKLDTQQQSSSMLSEMSESQLKEYKLRQKFQNLENFDEILAEEFITTEKKKSPQMNFEFEKFHPKIQDQNYRSILDVYNKIIENHKSTQSQVDASKKDVIEEESGISISNRDDTLMDYFKVPRKVSKMGKDDQKVNDLDQDKENIVQEPEFKNNYDLFNQQIAPPINFKKVQKIQSKQQQEPKISTQVIANPQPQIIASSHPQINKAINRVVKNTSKNKQSRQKMVQNRGEKTKYEEMKDFLSPAEAKALVESWQQNHFNSFNVWIQKSQSLLTTEWKTEKNPNTNKMIFYGYFRLKMNPTVVNQGGVYLQATSCATCKKEATQIAYRKLVIDLIQKGLIKYGFENNRQYELAIQKYQLRESIPKIQSNDLPVNDDNENSQKNYLQKLKKKIRQALDDNKIDQVLQKLSLICNVKQTSYQDISQVWWSLLKRGQISYVQIMLELIHQRRFSQELRENLAQMSRVAHLGVTEKITPQSSDRDILKYLIELKYQVKRRPVENIYDYYFTHFFQGTRRALSENNLMMMMLESIDSNLHSNNHYKQLNFSYLQTYEVNLALVEQNQVLKIKNEPQAMRPQLQNPFLFYYSVEILREMFNSLLLNDNLLESMKVAELMYQKIKVQESEGIEPTSAQYFINQYVQLVHHQLESIYQKIYYPYRSGWSTITVEGVVKYLGNNQQECWIQFQTDSLSTVEAGKVLRRKQFIFCQKDQLNKICENDLVMLTLSGSQDQVQNSNIQKQGVLVKYLRSLSKTERQSQIFYLKQSIGDDVNYAVLGVVREIQKNQNLRIFLNVENDLEREILMTPRKWKLMKLHSLNNFYQISECLATFTVSRCLDQNLQRIILSAENQDLSEISSQKVSELHDQGSLDVQLGQYLNASQYEAIVKGCCQRLSLIEGMRRSGKKRVLAKILSQWIQLNADKILLVTDSIETSLQLSAYLKEHSFTNFFHVIEEQLNPVTRKNEANFMQQFDSKSSLKKSLLRDRIFLTEINNCQFSYLKNCEFKKVVVYNSQNITESECLQMFVKNVNQCVFIGDHQQYSSVLKDRNDDHMLSSSRGYKLSILYKLLQKGLPSVSLNIQYNPHHIIGSQIQQFLRNYYPNISQDPVGELEISNYKNIEELLWNSQISFVFNENSSETRCQSGQFINQQEIIILTQLFLDTLAHSKIEDLLVLVYSHEQKQKLIQEIFQVLTSQENTKLPVILDTTIQCVFQVDELPDKQVIIFGTTKTHEDKMNLLFDKSLINTILQKCLKKLIIVGDLNYLKIDHSWGELIKYISTQNQFFLYRK